MLLTHCWQAEQKSATGTGADVIISYIDKYKREERGYFWVVALIFQSLSVFDINPFYVFRFMVEELKNVRAYYAQRNTIKYDEKSFF